MDLKESAEVLSNAIDAKNRYTLDRQRVRDMIANGLGRQFDYEYAAIMLRPIDGGVADKATDVSR